MYMLQIYDIKKEDGGDGGGGDVMVTMTPCKRRMLRAGSEKGSRQVKNSDLSIHMRVSHECGPGT